MKEAKPGRPVAQSALVGAVFDAWDDLDRALDGIDPAAALRRWGGGNGSAFAWTLAHATELVDNWINRRFQDLPAHPLIGQPHFRAGGSGIADDWPALLAAVREVREQAAAFLAPLDEDGLSRSIPYSGSVRGVRNHGRLPLRYALIRIIAHHYLHIGEIELKRRESDTPVPGDFPGQLYATLDGERTT
jgi:hypothetical protein